MVRTLFRPSSKKSTAKGVVFQNIVSYLEVVLKGHLILCFTNSGLQLSLSGSRLGFYKIEDGIKKHQRAGSEALCCFKDTYCSVTVDRGPTTPFSMAEAPCESFESVSFLLWNFLCFPVSVTISKRKQRTSHNTSPRATRSYASSPCLPLASCHRVLLSSPQVFEGTLPVWNPPPLPLPSANTHLPFLILFKHHFLPETSHS